MGTADKGRFEVNTPEGPAVMSQDGAVLLSDILTIDLSNGDLTWKRRLSETSTRDKSFNLQFAGKPALSGIQDGYKRGAIFNHKFRAHRVVFAMSNGAWPKHLIDHINGNKLDNSPENLRDVTQSQNLRNACTPVTNTSGAIGVIWCELHGLWQARIKVDGRNHFLGSFVDIADAVLARSAANKKYGFHPNHGRPTEIGSKP